MNSDRIKVLVNIYLDKYDEMTANDEQLLGTWEAVNTCAKNWDIEADDFGGMFSAAMKDASGLLENKTQKPLEGIRLLCRNGRQEEVRDGFRDLLDSRGDDIQGRQDRVTHFVHAINEMLYQEVPEQWQLRQKIRTGIRYLAIIDPNDNFMFKASEAAAFAGYTESEEDIGFDSGLKLNSYYNMCDEVVDYISTRQDLLKKVGRKLRQRGKAEGKPELKDIDANYHILAYDLIRDSYQHDFYSEKAANRKSKISTVQKRYLDKTRRRAGLLDEREKVVDEYDEITALEHKAEIPSLAGRQTTHKAYGRGTVTAQDGKYLTVQFEDGKSKKFVLPAAVTGGFLDFEDEKVADAAAAMDKVKAKKKNISDRLTAIDVQLKILEG